MHCGVVEESRVAVDPVVAEVFERSRPGEPRWCTVDRALRTLALRRAALDADEARWLREAEVLEIWHPLGMVSAQDYLERVLGYAPRTAYDRLRVARALGDLPGLTAALAGGALPFSAIRELTRVATPATEAAWIAAVTGKNLRQIEELVADHRPGDRPDDPPDPSARTHVVRFELSAETFALLRQARTVLDDEHGTNLPEDAFIAAMCNAVLGGASQAEPTGRAKFQIAMTVCERCRQGWQEGAGAQIAVAPAAVERALCDAQHIGSIDGTEPERAYQDIPPSVARLVWRRDGGRCRVPGCRSSRGLELHHLIHRADGGSHDASNIVLACGACHQAHHDGRLTISGTADRIEVRRPGAHVGATSAATLVAHSGGVDAVVAARPGAHVDAAPAARPDVHVDAASAARPDVHVDTAPVARPSAHVDAVSKLDGAIVRTQAKAALIGLGWKPTIAHAAVAAAAAALGTELALERLIVEALRRCPVPSA
jgi:HNH endonuclease